MKQGTNAKLPGSWGLLKGALRHYKQHFWQLLGIVMLVSLPVALIGAFAGAGGDTATSAYLTFAQLSMNAAITYAVIQILHHKAEVGIRRAYYDGSGALVRLILVWFMMVVMLIPALLGILVLQYGIIAPGTVLGAGEKALLIVLAGLLILPSIYLIIRSLWATFVIFETPDGPVQALGQSWGLSRKRVLATIGRIGALVIFLLLLLALPVIALTFLGQLTKLAIFGVILQVTAAAIVLPVANLYAYRLYQALKS